MPTAGGKYIGAPVVGPIPAVVSRPARRGGRDVQIGAVVVVEVMGELVDRHVRVQLGQLLPGPPPACSSVIPAAVHVIVWTDRQ